MLAITGSRVRAAILRELFGDDPRPRAISDLARATGADYSAIRREVLALVRDGVLRPARSDRKLGPVYEGDPEFPGHLELRRLVLVTEGLPARIREAIAAVDPRALGWLYGRDAESASFMPVVRLAAITRDARGVRERLQAIETEPGQRLALEAMSIDEWTYRLERREMRVLAIRRAQRLWLLGDGEALRTLESSAIGGRRIWRDAIKNWREELSDDWDDDFDPFAPVPGPAF